MRVTAGYCVYSKMLKLEQNSSLMDKLCETQR